MIHLVALSCIFFFQKAEGAYMGGYLLTPLVIEQLAPSPDHTAHLPHQKVMQCHWIKKLPFSHHWWEYCSGSTSTFVGWQNSLVAFSIWKIILPFFSAALWTLSHARFVNHAPTLSFSPLESFQISLLLYLTTWSLGQNNSIKVQDEIKTIWNFPNKCAGSAGRPAFANG